MKTRRAGSEDLAHAVHESLADLGEIEGFGEGLLDRRGWGRTQRQRHDRAVARAAGVGRPEVTLAVGADHLLTWLFLPMVILAGLAGLWLGRRWARREAGRAVTATHEGREAGPSAGQPRSDAVVDPPAAIEKTIAEALDLPEVGQRIVDGVRKILGARAAGLHSLESSGIMPTIAVSGDVRSTWAANRVYPPGTGVIGRAVVEGRTVMTPDSLADPRIKYPADFAERLRQAGYRAILAVPLAVEGKTVGVLAVGDVPGRVFTDEEIQLVQAFAAQATLAFANARLYDEAKRRRAEAERASQAKDELLAMLAEESPKLRERLIRRIVAKVYVERAPKSVRHDEPLRDPTIDPAQLPPSIRALATSAAAEAVTI